MSSGGGLTNSTATIGATAGSIIAGRSGRRSVVVQNLHASNDLYIGDDANVTTSNGVKVAAGQSISFEEYIGPVYGIASGAGTDVRVLEVH